MHDLIIIGSGPGGYEAAIRARQNGLSVLLFEKGDIGGTCLNRGCIPTKALLHAAELLECMKTADEWGIHAAASLDADILYCRKSAVVADLRGGIEQLLKAHGVEVVNAEAAFLGNGNVRANGIVYEAASVILATGSVPSFPPIEGIKNNPMVVTSDEMLLAPPRSDDIVILGGGVIGVEMAAFCLSIGMQVTIIEALPRILPLMDKEISQSVGMNLKKKGANILTGARLLRVDTTGESLDLHLEGRDETLNAGMMLVATGRGGCLDNLLAECVVRPEIRRGRILTDSDCKTSLPNVYAIGDITMGPQLAHAASAQGRFVADLLAGIPMETQIAVIPSCIYTSPEIAAVGLTEAEAKEQGIEAVAGKYIMGGNGRTMIAGSGRGFIKVVVEKETEIILGAQLMCERATDIIDEFTVALVNRLTVTDMLKAVRPHPTFTEGIQEALESIHNRAIHMSPSKRRG